MNTFSLSEKQFFVRDNPETESKIMQQLASVHESENQEGLKRIIALVIMGKNTSKYFSEVSKLLHKKSATTKRLCHVILSHSFEDSRDKALLPINLLVKVFPFKLCSAF